MGSSAIFVCLLFLYILCMLPECSSTFSSFQLDVLVDNIGRTIVWTQLYSVSHYPVLQRETTSGQGLVVWAIMRCGCVCGPVIG